MDKKEMIQFLELKLNEIPNLMNLGYGNHEYENWHNLIEDVLELQCGTDSIEYKRFKNSKPRYVVTISMDGSSQNRWYIDDVKSHESALKSIIEVNKLSKEDNPRGNNTSQLPIELFDAMQFHPRVVEASRSCFITKNYREAILNTFVTFIECVKEKTNLDLDGVDLMNQVFPLAYDKEKKEITKYPIIQVNGLKSKTDRDEQEGFWYLGKGAVTGIRNVYAHKLVQQTNPLHTLEYLAFASLLVRRIEEGKTLKTPSKRNKWDWDSFLSNTQSKCVPEIVDLVKELHEFTKINADDLSWGTGKNDGSFTFKKFGGGKLISVFSVYSYGYFCVYFSSLKYNAIPNTIIESFRENLTKIPNIVISNKSMNKGSYHIPNKVLVNQANLGLFKEAVMYLCKKLNDFKGES
jgi:uncharacterized protein (TIGR02391 family)